MEAMLVESLRRIDQQYRGALFRIDRIAEGITSAGKFGEWIERHPEPKAQSYWDLNEDGKRFIDRDQWHALIQETQQASEPMSKIVKRWKTKLEGIRKQKIETLLWTEDSVLWGIRVVIGEASAPAYPELRTFVDHIKAVYTPEPF